MAEVQYCVCGHLGVLAQLGCSAIRRSRGVSTLDRGLNELEMRHVLNALCIRSISSNGVTFVATEDGLYVASLVGRSG